MAHSRRTGFTLIEMLVVIFIVGMLAALLIPAVQHAREAARRIACVNNLKNLGLGLQNHQANLNTFPAGRGRIGESYLLRILPFIEQTQLYNSLNLEFLGGTDVVRNENQTAFVYQVNGFFCPSDRSRSDPISWASANYVGNAGSTGGNFLTGDGVFIGKPLAPRDITDGLSQTVALSEWVVGSGTKLRRSRLGSVYKLSDSITEFNLFHTSCDHVNTSLEQITVPYKGVFWISGGYGSTLYNHVLPPNLPSCFNRSFEATTAASNHGSGVHVLTLDGSVHHVLASINPKVWTFLSTRAGAEVLADDAF